MRPTTLFVPSGLSLSADVFFALYAALRELGLPMAPMCVPSAALLPRLLRELRVGGIAFRSVEPGHLDLFETLRRKAA